MQRILEAMAGFNPGVRAKTAAHGRHSPEADASRATAMRELEATLLSTMLDAALPKTVSGMSKGAGGQFARSQLAMHLANAITGRGGLGLVS